MSRNYYNRYQDYITDRKFRIIPGIEMPIKPTDKYLQYKKGKHRMDILSQEYYGSPMFGWLILLANPSVGSIEFEIPDNSYIRVPFPLLSSLQDYKNGVELYNLYYGEQ